MGSKFSDPSPPFWGSLLFWHLPGLTMHLSLAIIDRFLKVKCPFVGFQICQVHLNTYKAAGSISLELPVQEMRYNSILCHRNWPQKAYPSCMIWFIVPLEEFLNWSSSASAAVIPEFICHQVLQYCPNRVSNQLVIHQCSYLKCPPK